MGHFLELVAVSAKAEKNVVGEDESKESEAECEAVYSKPLDVGMQY